MRRVLSSVLPLALSFAAGCAPPDAEAPSVPDASAVPDVSVVDAAIARDAGPIADAPTADAGSPTDALTDAPTDAPTDTPDVAPSWGGSEPSPSCPQGCPAGQQCYSEGCLPVAGPGQVCGPSAPASRYPLGCAGGHTCARGDDGYRCVPNGARGAYCRYDAPHCDPGLACSTGPSGQCVPALPRGAFCGLGGTPCEEGTHCRGPDGVFRCLADGTPGAATRAARRVDGGFDRSNQCDPGLVSTPLEWVDGADGTCRRPVSAASVCDPGTEVCPAGEACVAVDGGLRPWRCVPHGTLGAPCVAEVGAMGRCDAGLTCAWGNSVAGTRCRRIAGAGEACEATSDRVRCAEGLGCTSDDPMEPGRCVAPGSAEGADCGQGGCVAGTTCAQFSRYRSTCRATRAVGEPCDLGAIARVCEGGAVCLATALARDGHALAVCARSTPEVEPNDTPAVLRDAPAVSRVYAGSLSADDRRDCYAVRVTAGGALRFDLSMGPDGSFSFTESLDLTLHGPDGAERGRWRPRPDNHGPTGQTGRVRPTEVSALRALGAGVWSVCVTRATDLAQTSPRVPYTLSVAALPPSM